MFVGMSCFELDNSDEPEDQVTSFFDDWATGDVFDNDNDVRDLVPYFKSDELIEEFDLDDFQDQKTAVPTTEEYVGLATKGTSEHWLLDSGATCGVTYSKLGMTNLKPTDRKITIGNGDQVQALGQGTVTLNDSQGKSVTLDDVYYAPKFTKHIVSLRKLLDDDWKLAVTDKAEFVLKSPSDNARYQVVPKTNSTTWQVCVLPV